MKSNKLQGAVVVAMLLFVSIGSALILYMGKDVRRSRKLPTFQLESHTGQTISQDDVKGKIVVAQFFFTSCETLCPNVSSVMAKMHDRYLGEKEVVFLTHTLDPLRDSRQVLANFADSIGAVKDRWHFLRTDDQEEIYRIANSGYWVSAKPEEWAAHGISHDTKIVLLDHLGSIRGYYDAEKERKVKRLEDDIQGLLDEMRNSS